MAAMSAGSGLCVNPAERSTPMTNERYGIQWCTRDELRNTPYVWRERGGAVLSDIEEEHHEGEHREGVHHEGGNEKAKMTMNL